jgi:hypothetical protein
MQAQCHAGDTKPYEQVIRNLGLYINSALLEYREGLYDLQIVSQSIK